jgi:sulfatase maturation enzyme AslB (radical SAM superfamily)
MKCSEFFSKQNEVLHFIYLIFAHLTCIVLQPCKFHCHYCKLQGENLYEIYSVDVAEENIDKLYNLNLFLQV